MMLIRVIASRDTSGALRLLEASPELARQAVVIGATRHVSADYYFKEIALSERLSWPRGAVQISFRQIRGTSDWRESKPAELPS